MKEPRLTKAQRDGIPGRLNQAVAAYGTARGLANAAGIPERSLSALRKGKDTLGQKRAERLAAPAGTTAAWLLKGEGEPPAPRPNHGAFFAEVQTRLDRGRLIFGERSLERPSPELLREIQQELADVCGWSALLWERLERLRSGLYTERMTLKPTLATPLECVSCGYNPCLCDQQ